MHKINNKCTKLNIHIDKKDYRFRFEMFILYKVCWNECGNCLTLSHNSAQGHW